MRFCGGRAVLSARMRVLLSFMTGCLIRVAVGVAGVEEVFRSSNTTNTPLQVNLCIQNVTEVRARLYLAAE